VTQPSVLRLIDFGRVSPLHSQTLWHALAYGVSAGAPPTLAFARPAEPYVSIGYHRRLDEIELDRCRESRLPVYRRMVGGGPVYLDDDQLFFQIVVSAADVPRRRDQELRRLLGPAVDAFNAAGVPAALDAGGEIVVGDRKVCGHGAGQIEDAVVVVGNMIERFDHSAATGILRLPDTRLRDVVLRLMRRYVAATRADTDTFKRSSASASPSSTAASTTRSGCAAPHARRPRRRRSRCGPACGRSPQRRAERGPWPASCGGGSTRSPSRTRS
jgi:lipoate-protein ligase A